MVIELLVPVTTAWRDELEKKAQDALTRAIGQSIPPRGSLDSQAGVRKGNQFDDLNDEKVILCLIGLWYNLRPIQVLSSRCCYFMLLCCYVVIITAVFSCWSGYAVSYKQTLSRPARLGLPMLQRVVSC